MLGLFKKHNMPFTFLIAYVFSAYEVLEDIVINTDTLNLVRPITLVKNIGSNLLFVGLTVVIMLLYLFIKSIFQKDYPLLKETAQRFFGSLIALLPFFIFFGAYTVYEFICDSMVSFKQNLFNSPQYLIFIILLVIYLIIDFKTTIVKFLERIGVLLYPLGIMARLVSAFILMNMVLILIFIFVRHLKIMETEGVYILSVLCNFLILEYYFLLIYREIQGIRGEEYINFD